MLKTLETWCARRLWQSARSIQTLSMGKCVAVLYQELEPPVINGVRKPKKPGGYRDSGSDIAYVLRHRCDIQVVTPAAEPSPKSDEGWCFPDNEHGILEAVERGATHLWANTILFANHPLQTSSKLTLQEKKVHVVGQPPLLVEIYDDKHLVNTWLRKQEGFTVPRFFSLSELNDLEPALAKNKMQLPLVAKPVRGRGSHGVKACFTFSELVKHVHRLLGESPTCMVEEFLAGQEITITVMPPSPDRPKHWALPIVSRFNHERGIAPYNGLVAVTRNSKVLSSEEYESDPLYAKAVQECEYVAKLLHCTAPIRIDMRRLVDKNDSPFALFDVNMKPNMTGPGRPGREDQAGLSAMAASRLGWDYSMLLKQILDSSSLLHDLRHVATPMGFKSYPFQC